MLVLTRKPSQSIMIGDEIEVTVLSISGDKVRIGVRAPDDVAIFRREIYDAVAPGQVELGLPPPKTEQLAD
jgi:carbon storage regulator